MAGARPRLLESLLQTFGGRREVLHELLHHTGRRLYGVQQADALTHEVGGKFGCPGVAARPQPYRRGGGQVR